MNIEEENKKLKAELERAKSEIRGVLKHMPNATHCIGEKSTDDDLYASLALSVARLSHELERMTKDREAWIDKCSKMLYERDTARQQLQEACELLKHLHKEVLATDYNEHWESFTKLETFLAIQGRKDK